MSLNAFRPRQNGRHFPDDIFKCNFLNENILISIKISLKFVLKHLIKHITSLVQIMAWRRPGDKPLSDPWWLVYWRIYASLGLNELKSEWVFASQYNACWWPGDARSQGINQYMVLTRDIPGPRGKIWYSKFHYSDVIMGAIASQITGLTIAYAIIYSGADQRKHQSSVSLALVRGIHRSPVNSPHKWPETRKMLPFDDVIMFAISREILNLWSMTKGPFYG